VEDELERLREQAEDELELAQQAFDDLLAEIDGEQVLAARGRLIVARERYEAAMDQLQARLTGEHSLRVQAARAMLAQAQALAEQTAANAEQLAAGVAQAEGAVAQAQAALNLVQLQLERLVVRASIPGVVLTRSVEPGEILPPGMGAITIGQMEKMTITVYIPEDRYGEITLGDAASVTADSFPDVVFPAVVVRISDQAEYTPRNVQTEEDRKSTVFAIDLSVQDDAGLLKPGMPADVLFDG
jgi:multidrug resistance efflux pump